LYRILALKLVFLGEVAKQFLGLARLDLGEFDSVITGPSLEFAQLVFTCLF
jgi:hypothetical protein